LTKFFIEGSHDRALVGVVLLSSTGRPGRLRTEWLTEVGAQRLIKDGYLPPPAEPGLAD
jgi:hypothetical protein